MSRAIEPVVAAGPVRRPGPDQDYGRHFAVFLPDTPRNSAHKVFFLRIRVSQDLVGNLLSC